MRYDQVISRVDNNTMLRFGAVEGLDGFIHST